jgi:transposase
MTESGKGVPIDRAAKALGKSPKTIVDWIHRGKLPAHKEDVAGHEEWRVDVDKADILVCEYLLVKKDEDISRLAEEVALLRSQIEAKDKQISEMHALLTRTQRKALSEPGKAPWWQFWR